MGMPNNLIFVRHGLSEPNKIHKAERDGDLHPAHDAVYARPDWEQRLAPEGPSQAQLAGQLLRSIDFPLERFDKRYVTSFLRGRETAYYLDQTVQVEWIVEDRIKERDWGEYGATPIATRDAKFAFNTKAKNENSWFARHASGESLADDVRMRYRDWVGTLHREADGQDVLAVAHGEFMTVARYDIESMLPEQIMQIAEDKSQEIRNCAVLCYTRENPQDPDDVRGKLSWMRMLYPDALEESPNAGQWQEIERSRYLTTAQLRQSLDKAQPFIDRT